MYNWLALYFISPYLTNKNVNSKHNFLSWLSLLLFCLYCIYSGDWLHYEEKLDFYEYYGASGLEPIYDVILSYIGHNYILFRFIVWGSALLFLRALLYRLSVNNFRTLGFYIIWGILFFAYARVSLGLSSFFYGFSLFIKPLEHNRKLGYIWGAICIIISFFFHKSIILLILLIPFVFIGLTKKKFIIYCFCSLIAVFILNSLLYYLDVLLIGIDGIEYFSNEKGARTLGGTIVTFCLRTPLYLLLIYLIYKLLWKSKYENLPIYIQRFFTFVVLISLVAFIFRLSNIKSQVLFYRTLYMIFIPLSIVLSEVFTILKRKTILIYTLLAYFGGNIWLFYTFLGHLNGTIK